jgi:16S rRNA (uracil1498-N3)-methyltransferase
MPQFYLPGPWENQKPNTLTPELVHHLRVRRIQVGEFFPIFDGKGQVAKAKLLSLGNKSGEAELSDVRLDTIVRALMPLPWHKAWLVATRWIGLSRRP